MYVGLLATPAKLLNTRLMAEACISELNIEYGITRSGSLLPTFVKFTMGLPCGNAESMHLE